MLVTANRLRQVRDAVPPQQYLLPTECEFYQAYNWCLNPFPTVLEAIDRLRGEIDRLKVVPHDWQAGEVATNVFLLSCALLNAVDEYLRGPTLRMSRPLAAIGLGRSARWATEGLTGILPQRDRAQARHTTIDTTIVAKDVDKGTGLSVLRDWVLRPDAETIAVGDSERDLPMFRAATDSFAPANIDCVRKAQLLGCQIVRHPYQRGLLQIARSLVHPHGGSCERCAEGKALRPGGPTLFLELLQAADEGRARNLCRGLVDPAVFKILMR